MYTRHRIIGPELKAELMCNPYTARVTDTNIVFTRAFKEYLLEEIRKPEVTLREAFNRAGYTQDIFTDARIWGIISRFRKEAASPGGLKEPRMPRKQEPAEQTAKGQVKDLRDRIDLLERQVAYLKKSQALREQERNTP